MPCRKPRFRRVREIRYSPAYRNDKLIRPFLLATSLARVLHRSLSLPENRGRREDRVHAAPAVSCAIAHKERAHEHTGTGGASRPSLRSGFTAYFVLSPVNGFFATVASERSFASLGLNASTATSGPHDFTVRSSHTRQSQLSRPPHPTARS
jgi:hypothetical protein